MSDDRFDDWIGDAAQGYNAPPSSVPREEMWTAIASGLGTRDAEGQDSGHEPSDKTPFARRSALVPRPWLTAWRAAAAMSLVAAGLAGGYWLRGRSTTLAPTVAAVDSTGAASNSLNQALIQHLTDAEALLVAYRGGAEQEGDVNMQRWARDVLGTTRLLLDSPVAALPGRRRLLEDLELVLVQIASLSSRAPADERDLTSQSLTREQLLTRLRSTIPAGVVSGT